MHEWLIPSDRRTSGKISEQQKGSLRLRVSSSEVSGWQAGLLIYMPNSCIVPAYMGCSGEVGRTSFKRDFKNWSLVTVGRRKIGTEMYITEIVQWRTEKKKKGGEVWQWGEVSKCDEANELTRLDCSPPILAYRIQTPAGPLPYNHKWESCRNMPVFGEFSRGTAIFSALAFRRCSILTSFHHHGLSETSFLRATQVPQQLSPHLEFRSLTLFQFLHTWKSSAGRSKMLAGLNRFLDRMHVTHVSKTEEMKRRTLVDDETPRWATPSHKNDGLNQYGVNREPVSGTGKLVAVTSSKLVNDPRILIPQPLSWNQPDTAVAITLKYSSPAKANRVRFPVGVAPGFFHLGIALDDGDVRRVFSVISAQISSLIT
ncbi:hypothetical protein PR048_014340 [Dryococelus australis]|uniref:Uncharacterized protein n=1 Tax=Dryococelus australis TaxID=614101 RepID=A0ABQ9HE42_9NEOP|nr:hypothetical protein PR048_014340 [Dryococelus australis]